MQIIPIIISEKILKKIFLDSIDQINKAIADMRNGLTAGRIIIQL